MISDWEVYAEEIIAIIVLRCMHMSGLTLLIVMTTMV